MLFNLYNAWQDWLNEQGLGFFRIFSFVTFRTVSALILSFFIVFFLGKPTIRRLVKLKVGDNPEFHDAKVNELMKDKANVPTMGGVLIAFSILLTTFLLADITSFYVHMAVLTLVWLTLLGSVDDILKLTTARREEGGRDGLRSWEKLLFQLGLAVLLGWFIYSHGQSNDVEQAKMAYSLNLPFLSTWEKVAGEWVPSPHLIELGAIAFMFLTVIVIVGSSNAVNLADGMDGLASGITAICGLAFVVLTIIAGSEDAAKFLRVPFIRYSDELAVVTAAMVGACLGFLWYNCAPAQVFMGDTGSLPLGGLLGYIAVVIRQEFLLMIIGGIFVMEAVSVILQVGFYKLTARLTGKGKRLFAMAPFHHHFQKSEKHEWKETQIVIRFWLISALLAAVALATIKLR